MTTSTSTVINGINTEFVRSLVKSVATDPAEGQSHWQVTTSWLGGARSESRATQYVVGGRTVDTDFTLRADAPSALGGTGQYPHQEAYLFTALNACMVGAYAFMCSMQGIELEELRIETKGDMDVRGFMDIEPGIKPGFEEIEYTVHIKGNGTPEQFQHIHEAVTRLSPNRYNIANAIRLKSTLIVE